MRHLHPHRPRKATVRERSHRHGALPTRRHPSSQLIFDGVVAGYIHDISSHGPTGSDPFRRFPHRPVVDT